MTLTLMRLTVPGDVFVDTSAWYALLSRRDEHHPAAARIFRRLYDEGVRLWTHNYVIVETVALVGRRLGIAVLRTFLTDLLPVARVVWVGADIHEAAVAALLGAARKDVSLVDWVSIELLRRSSRRRVFAFDKDFVRAGLEVEAAET